MKVAVKYAVNLSKSSEPACKKFEKTVKGKMNHELAKKMKNAAQDIEQYK